ncbi:MAG: hypothetical protein ACMUIA_10385 [bacterium]
MSFNPSGSFLLGTATEGARNGARLHDNLLSMKFQLMLNLALGVFYHTGNIQGTGFTKNISGEQISCRGMIFGGSFGNPTVGGSGGWRVTTNNWGFGGPGSPPDMNFPYNLPSLSSMTTWNSNYLLTCGWACVSMTLFLTNYLFNNYTDYGSASVRDMIRRTPQHPLHDRFTEHAPGDRNQTTVGQADMCIFCRTNHEYAIVKIKPAGNLLRETNLPAKGFLSAYHPLDGTPQASMSGGEIFSDTATSLGSDNSVTTTLRPIRIMGMGTPVVRDYQSLYADRAVPFPTMQEARNKFPTVGSILTHIRRAQHAVWKVLHGQLVLSAQPNSNYQYLIPPLQPPQPVPTTPSSPAPPTSSGT